MNSKVTRTERERSNAFQLHLWACRSIRRPCKTFENRVLLKMPLQIAMPRSPGGIFCESRITVNDNTMLFAQ